nr:hypothetical protein [Enterococcus faecalis]
GRDEEEDVDAAGNAPHENVVDHDEEDREPSESMHVGAEDSLFLRRFSSMREGRRCGRGHENVSVVRRGSLSRLWN